jgi:hypothetical protein
MARLPDIHVDHEVLHDDAVRAVAHVLRKAKDWQDGQDYLSNHEIYGPWLRYLFDDEDEGIITEMQSIIREAEQRIGDALPY